MKREWTILVDSREKRALPLPSTMEVRDWSTFYPRDGMVTVRIHTKEVALITGDYCVEGHSRDCLIERKGSLTELSKNLRDSVDRVRFFKQLERLRDESDHPVLFVEGDPLSWGTKRTDGIDPFLLRDCLFQAQHRFGVHLVLLPCNSASARREAAKWLVALLLSRIHTRPDPRPEIPGTAVPCGGLADTLMGNTQPQG